MQNTTHYWIVLACYLRFVACQDVASITTSKSPVYNGESVMLTCVIDAQDAAILSVTLYAFKETREVATLFTRTVVTSQTSIGTGLFSGYSFTGYDTVANKGPRLSVSIDASPSWELDYRCTFSVFEENLNARVNLTSDFFRLSVWVLPKVPSLLPSLLVFNETDNISLDCSSLGGTPVSAIDLVVLPQTSGNSLQTNGSTSVSLKLPGPATGWHNAQVTCRVKNHNLPNMTARSVIRVNHIAARHDAPLIVKTYSSSQTLECSDHVLGFPKPSYMWWLPGDTYINELPPFNSGLLTVPQGRSGLFICIAVNKATTKIVLITYQVTNELMGSKELIEWLIPVLCLLIVGLSVALVVLNKRAHLRRREAAAFGFQKPMQGTCRTHVSSEHKEVAATKKHTDNCQYQSLNLQTMNEQNYEKLSAPKGNNAAAYEVFQS